MRLPTEIERLLTIMLISPAIGFGTLVILDAGRVVPHQYVGKGAFVLIGFIVAIVSALILFRSWPSS